VVGLPDERWGQRVVAVLVSRGQSNVDVASVLAMSQERLASFKVPRQMECWDELPRTSLGKLRRAEVRERLLQCSARS
jgi:fatty-acyl-CoA synthase